MLFNTGIPVLFNTALPVKKGFDAAQMSMDEIMIRGLIVTVIGFVLVILVLVFIALVLWIFGLITSKTSNENKLSQAAPVTAVPVSVPAQPQPAQTDLAKDLELVAVITAAIAAQANTSPDKLVVRNLRLRHSKRTQWNNEALQEQQQSIF